MSSRKNRRSLESRRAWLFGVVPEDEFVAQDVVATDGANGVLAEPALARHFSGHGGLMSGDRIREFRDRQGGGAGGNVIQMGGAGGGGPIGGGGGPVMIFGGGGGGGRGFGNFNINKPHGTVFYQAGNSIFDAKPYSLTGQPTVKPDYNQSRFGAFLGGPLNIPKIYHGGTKTFFFGGFAT